MPERWYLPFYGFARPDMLVHQISNWVREFGLADSVPRLCLERKRSRKADQLYFFLGIHSAERGRIPNELDPLIAHIRKYGHPLEGQALAIEEIEKMIGKEIDISSDFTRRIEFHLPPDLHSEDPFAYSPELYIHEQEPEKFQAYDNLLYWMTASGGGSWNSFTQACREILSSDSRPSRQLFRRFHLLGHVEYLDSGNKWTIAPACLVRIDDTDQYSYFLTGQRTVGLERTVAEYALWTSTLLHPDLAAPVCRRFTFESEAEAQRAASEIPLLHFAGNAAKKLADAIPDILGWQEVQQRLRGSQIPIGLYHFQKWENGDFVDKPFEEQSGLYHLTRRDVSDNAPEFTLFYDSSRDGWLRGDWYGLRYLAQLKANDPCHVHYSASRCCLAIPLDKRWPEIYERALILASGQLPVLQDNWLYFSDISLSLSQTLAEKLQALWHEENENA